MISVITVYNDRRVLDENLGLSLQGQDSKFQFIELDNTSGKYPSAANALNEGAGGAAGDYLMFAHQDIQLPNHRWLGEVEKTLSTIPNLGIAGPIGIRLRGFYPDVVGQIRSPTYVRGKKIGAPTPVHTLDEVTLLIPRKVFDRLKFDEKTYQKCWHCYGADYCLSVKKLGLDVMTIPAFLFHNSDWRAKPWHEDVHRCARIMIAKHGGDYNLIWTNSAGGLSKGPIGSIKRMAGIISCYARDAVGIEAPTVSFGP